MLLVDDLVLFPFRGLMRVFRELDEAARKEQASEADRLKAQLRELYMQLEAGQISEEEFDAAEDEILDLLDALQAEQDTEDAADLVDTETTQANAQSPRVPTEPCATDS